MNCPQCKSENTVINGVCTNCDHAVDKSRVMPTKTAEALGIANEGEVIEVTPEMEKVLDDIARFLERKEKRDNSKLFQALKFIVIVGLLFYLVYFEGIVYKRIAPAYTYLGAALILVLAYLLPYFYMLIKIVQLRYCYKMRNKENEEK